MKPVSVAAVVAAGALAALAGALVLRRPSSTPTTAAEGPRFFAIRAEEVTLDGTLSEPEWERAASTGAFTGGPPYTEARILWTDVGLYVGIVAADEDIRSTDRLIVKLGSREFAVSPLGDVEPGADGVTAAVSYDGVLDDREDEDEQWTAEVELPWLAIGCEATDSPCPISLERRDESDDAPAKSFRFPSTGSVALERVPE